MREATFLNQNADKWKKVEGILDKKNQLDSKETGNLFVELTDDLSYARTHYPKSEVTRYLNALSSGIYQRITRTRHVNFKSMVNFWTRDIPIATARNHKTMLVVFLFFVACMLIGVVSTHFDESYSRVVLGDAYVDMTIHNIESGDPMAVYKDKNAGGMFFGITSNNIKVSAKTFVAGALVGIGSLYFLFVNGVMLGTFQYFFVGYDLFWESFLAIWIHGTIEISCIVIAGTAGVVLGRSFLFPGSYSRKQSLIFYSKDAFKIYIGTVPLIILAGFLESFVTRLTEAPLIFRLLIILGSLSFILWYFVILPTILRKKLKLDEIR